jgi:hypothetical protein
MSPSRPEEMPVPRALAEAWRADRAWPDEVRRSYQRFLSKGRARQRSAVSSLARWVTLGVLLGVGLAQAASLVPWASSSGARQRAVPARASSGRAGFAPKPWAAPIAAPSRTESAASPPPTSPAPTPTLTSRSVAVPTLASSAVSARVQARWQDAAAALRADDFVSAERALLEIELSTAGAQRDAARLARAQLLWRHGRTREALPILNDLGEHAKSELVRAQARGLSNREREIDSTNRSARPAGDTHEP